MICRDVCVYSIYCLTLPIKAWTVHYCERKIVAAKVKIKAFVIEGNNQTTVTEKQSRLSKFKQKCILGQSVGMPL